MPLQNRWFRHFWLKGLNSLPNKGESQAAEKSRFLFPNKKFDTASGKKIFGLVVAAACLAYYSWLLGTNVCDVAGGADSSGYVNFAWRLRHGGLVDQIKGIEILGLGDEFVPIFYPLGFTRGPKSRTMVPEYPAGLPIFMVIFAELFGWNLGPFLVSPLAAIACLFLMYGLSRKYGLSPPWSLLGAAVLALFAVFLFQAVQPMSDILAMAWGMLAVFAAILARKRTGWAWLAGAAFGLNVLVRPTNIFLLLPLVFALPAKPRVYLRFVLGGLLFGVLQAALNQTLFGSALVSPYRGQQLSSVVMAELTKRIALFGKWLCGMLTVVFPLAWLVAPANRLIPRRDRWLLIFWFAPFLILYSIFDFVNMWTFVRYLLPGLPALILSGLLMMRDAVEFGRRKIRAVRRFAGRPPTWLIRLPMVAVGVLCFFILRAEKHEIRDLKVMEVNEYEAVYRTSCQAVRGAVPERSVVLAMQLSGALTYYTKVLPARWDLMTPKQFEVLSQKAALNGYRIYALLFPFEEQEFLKNAPGAWEKISNYEFVTLWKYQGP